MNLPSVNVLSAILLASELALALTKRSKSRATGKDRFTLPLLWTVIGLSIWAAFFLRAACPQGRLPYPRVFYIIGLILFVLGLIVRWAAIIYLGRFFTVNVAIAEDHQLITTGPYRFVRHPVLHRHVPHFSRLRTLHAQHLLARRRLSPDRRRFSLAHARRGTRITGSLWRALSHLRRFDCANRPVAILMLNAPRSGCLISSIDRKALEALESVDHPDREIVIHPKPARRRIRYPSRRNGLLCQQTA